MVDATGRDRRVAVVTGGSAGVGRALVRRLAAMGFDVAVLSRGRAGVESAVDDAEGQGARALGVQVDVAEWEAVDSAADKVEEELGPIDVWVNNAMTTVFGRFADVSPGEFRRATEVTYLGQVHGTMAALNRMRPRDHGQVINVGSALCFIGIPLQSAYCGAKFAVRGFTESVQAELRSAGSAVRVSLVHLPAVNTPQFDWCENKLSRQPRPVAPVYPPDVAAEAIVAALDGRRSKILGSWNRLIIIGTKLSPHVLLNYAARTGVSGQQTEREADRSRPSNLFQPVDDDRDCGSAGRFVEESGGVLDPAFVSTIPSTMKGVALAAAGTLREKVRVLARRPREVSAPSSRTASAEGDHHRLAG